MLRPGDVNMVPLERHHVHGFTAGPAGASGLDITTRIVPDASRLPCSSAARDVQGRTFAARWQAGD